MYKFLIATIFALLFSFSAIAQVQNAAIFDPVGTTEESIKIIVLDDIYSISRTFRDINIIERQTVIKTLAENNFRINSNTQDSKFCEIGKTLKVRYVFVATVSTVGKSNYSVSCKVIDVTTSKVLKESSIQTRNGSNDLSSSTRQMMRDMLDALEGVFKKNNQAIDKKEEIVDSKDNSGNVADLMAVYKKEDAANAQAQKEKELAEAKAKEEKARAEAQAKKEKELAEAKAKEEKERAEAQAKKEKELAEAKAKEEKERAEAQAKRDKELAEAQAKREKELAEAQAKRDKELAEAQAQKEKELAEAQAKRDKELAEAQAQKEKELAEAQAQKEKELAEALAQKEKELAEAQAQKEKEIAEAQAQKEKEIAEAKAKIEKELADAQAQRERELAEAKAQKERELAEAQAKQEKELAEAKAKEKELAETKAQKEKELALLQAQQERELAEAKARQERELAEAKLRQEKELAETKAIEKEMAEAKAKQEKELALLQAQKEKELAEAKAKKEKELAEAKAKQEKELAEAKAKEKELADAKAQKERELAEAQAQKDKELAAVLAQKERELAEAQVQKEKELAELQAQKEKELAEVKAKKERELAEAKAQQERELAEAKAQQERELAEAKIQQERELAEAKAQQERELAEVRDQKERELAEAKAKEEKLKAEEEKRRNQEKAKLFLEKIPEYINFNPSGGKEILELFNSNFSWDESNVPAWCSIQKSKETLIISCDPNTNDNPREGNFLLQTEELSKKIYIKQLGAATLSVSLNKIDFTDSGGKKEITVNTNISSWKVTGNPSWCSINTTEDKIYLDCDANSYKKREFILDVRAGNRSEKIQVSQKEFVSLVISDTILEFPSSGGSRTITVNTSAASWNTSNELTWCPMAKSGNSIIFSCRSNLNTQERTDQFTIIADHATRIVKIKQQGISLLEKGDWKSAINKVIYTGATTYGNAVYKGERSNRGIRNGLGVYYFTADSESYWGDFLQGESSGKGLYMIGKEGDFYFSGCKGCKFYAGNWSSDMKNGLGKCYDKKGDLLYFGYFQNEKPIEPFPQNYNEPYKFACIEYDNGDTYLGETYRGYKHGLGIFFWANGAAWYGEWKDGTRDGNGIEFLRDGSIKTGRWIGDVYYE